MADIGSARPRRTWRVALGAAVLVVALALAVSGRSEAADGASALRPVGELEESMQASRPVSGSLVVGVALEAVTSPTAPLLGVYLPVGWVDETFCLWLRSRDGRYRAHQRFEVRREHRGRFTPPGGFTAVSLEGSAHGEYLETLSIGEIVPLFVRGDCELEVGGSIEATAAFWRTRPVAADLATHVTVYLNSLDADEAFVVVDGGPDYDCEALDATDAFEFDHACRIPMSVAERGTGPLSIEINRIKGGAFDRPVLATVAVKSRP